MATFTRKYYPGITLFKVIGAIMVVSGHIRTPQFFKALANHITGLEQFFFVIIPCFYIVAGFLAYNGWSHAKTPRQYVKRYLTWIIGVYLLIFVIAVVFKYIPLLLRTGGNQHKMLIIIMKMIYGFFVMGPILTFWFIPPLTLAIALCFYFDRKNKLNHAIILAISSFLIAQLTAGTLRSLIDVTIADNPLFHLKFADVCQHIILTYGGFGFPFVLSGVVIGKYQDQFLKTDGRKLALYTICFTITEALVLNYFVGGKYQYRIVLSMLPLGLWIFYGLLKIKSNRIQIYHKQLNMFSIITYFSHSIFITINYRLFGWQTQTLSTVQFIACSLLTLTECLALSTFILLLQRKKQLAVSTTS